MKILINFILSVLILISCTQKNHQRFPASLSEFKDHDGLVYISSYGQETEAHGFSSIAETIRAVNEKLQKADSESVRAFSISHYQVEELPRNQALAIDIDVAQDGRHILKIFTSKSKQETPEIAKEFDMTMKYILSRNYFSTPLSFFETAFNARNGETKSIIELRNIKKTVLETIAKNLEDNNFYEQELVKLTPEISEYESKLKLERKEQIKNEKLRKSSLAILDKADKDGQLRTLIQKNDRAGVVELLERYLPREYMTPIEHRYWNLILEKIANPAPIKDRVVMFRGTSGDKLYPMIKDGVEMTQEQAVKEGKLVAMSTMITRNQGTWNRRLRSLQTIYGKDFSLNSDNPSSKIPQTHRLSTWMKSHSISPEGSPFLSFSSELDISLRFGEDSLGAFLVDPDMLIFNQMSGYSNELEYLHVLMTFPDEMISYYDKEIDTKLGNSDIRKLIERRMKDNLKKIYGDESDEILDQIRQRSDSFRDKASAYLIPQYETVKVKKTKKVEPGFFGKLWAKITKKDPVYKTYYDYEKRVKKVENFNNCIYLIKAFI